LTGATPLRPIFRSALNELTPSQEGKPVDKLFFIANQRISNSSRLEIDQPSHESWLFDHPKILESVITGLEQAKYGIFSNSPPDLQADLSWLGDIEDEEE